MECVCVVKCGVMRKRKLETRRIRRRSRRRKIMKGKKSTKRSQEYWRKEEGKKGGKCAV